MKKAVYVLIGLVLLLGLFGPMILSHYKAPDNNNPTQIVDTDKGAPGDASGDTSLDVPKSSEGSKLPDATSGKNSQSMAKENESNEDKSQGPQEKKSDAGNVATSVNNKAGGNAKAYDGNAKPSDGESKQEPVANNNTTNTQQDSGSLKVDVAVVGKGGKIIFGPKTVSIAKDNRWGFTPLGALEATGLKYDAGSPFNGFVKSIEDMKNEGMQGWMYKVNDQVPMVGAADKKLNAGDKVIWWYSEGLDKPSPTWDKL